MIAHNLPTLGQEEESAAVRVLRSGWVAQGKEIQNFEDEFCAYLGVPAGNAVAVSSGTAALYLALWVLQAKDKKVAIPVYACAALRNAVAMAQGIELLLDVDECSANIDPETIQTGNPAIVVVPHMYGLPVEIQGCRDIDIIEDCAQSLGASARAIPVGLQGRIGIFSFYATKLITSGGQGGMIVSKDRSLIDGIRDYREFDQRRDQKRRFNLQMTDLQAAIGREQLKKLPSFLHRREEIFEAYTQAGMHLMDIQKSSKSKLKPVRYRAIVRTDKAKSMIQTLSKRNVKAIVPVEDWELLGDPAVFPNARKLSRETVSLPIYPSLSDAQIREIISVVAAV